METFNLKHVVLYAKHWYEHTDNIWNDLVSMLESDGYQGAFIGDSEKQIKNRVCSLLLNQMQRIPLTGNARTLSNFYELIKECNCWKFGYYTKNNGFFKNPEDATIEYDYDEAVARYCLSQFCSLDKTQWEVCKPDYKTHKKPKGITHKRVKEIFGIVLN